MASLHQALLDEVSLISFLEIFFPFCISFLANCASIDRRGAICRSCPPQASQAKLILMMCAVASVYAPEASYTFGKPPGWPYFAAVHNAHQELIPGGAPKLVNVQKIAVCLTGM
jgi:hypothetical protein